jgi:hypothetical protein
MRYNGSLDIWFTLSPTDVPTLPGLPEKSWMEDIWMAETDGYLWQLREHVDVTP